MSEKAPQISGQLTEKQAKFKRYIELVSKIDDYLHDEKNKADLETFGDFVNGEDGSIKWEGNEENIHIVCDAAEVDFEELKRLAYEITVPDKDKKSGDKRIKARKLPNFKKQAEELVGSVHVDESSVDSINSAIGVIEMYMTEHGDNPELQTLGKKRIDELKKLRGNPEIIEVPKKVKQVNGHKAKTSTAKVEKPKVSIKEHSTANTVVDSKNTTEKKQEGDLDIGPMIYGYLDDILEAKTKEEAIEIANEMKEAAGKEDHNKHNAHLMRAHVYPVWNALNGTGTIDYIKQENLREHIAGLLDIGVISDVNVKESGNVENGASLESLDIYDPNYFSREETLLKIEIQNLESELASLDGEKGKKAYGKKKRSLDDRLGDLRKKLESVNFAKSVKTIEDLIKKVELEKTPEQYVISLKYAYKNPDKIDTIPDKYDRILLLRLTKDRKVSTSESKSEILSPEKKEIVDEMVSAIVSLDTDSHFDNQSNPSKDTNIPSIRLGKKLMIIDDMGREDKQLELFANNLVVDLTESLSDFCNNGNKNFFGNSRALIEKNVDPVVFSKVNQTLEEIFSDKKQLDALENYFKELDVKEVGESQLVESSEDRKMMNEKILACNSIQEIWDFIDNNLDDVSRLYFNDRRGDSIFNLQRALQRLLAIDNIDGQREEFKKIALELSSRGSSYNLVEPFRTAIANILGLDLLEFHHPIKSPALPDLNDEDPEVKVAPDLNVSTPSPEELKIWVEEEIEANQQLETARNLYKEEQRKLKESTKPKGLLGVFKGLRNFAGDLLPAFKKTTPEWEQARINYENARKRYENAITNRMWLEEQERGGPIEAPKINIRYKKGLFSRKNKSIKSVEFEDSERHARMMGRISRTLLTNVAMPEYEGFKMANVEEVPAQEKGLLRKYLEWSSKLSPGKRILVNTAISTAVGAGIGLGAGLLGFNIALAGTGYLATRAIRVALGGAGSAALNNLYNITIGKWADKDIKSKAELSRSKLETEYNPLTGSVSALEDIDEKERRLRMWNVVGKGIVTAAGGLSASTVIGDALLGHSVGAFSTKDSSPSSNLEQFVPKTPRPSVTPIPKIPSDGIVDLPKQVSTAAGIASSEALDPSFRPELNNEVAPVVKIPKLRTTDSLNLRDIPDAKSVIAPEVNSIDNSSLNDIRFSTKLPKEEIYNRLRFGGSDVESSDTYINNELDDAGITEPISEIREPKVAIPYELDDAGITEPISDLDKADLRSDDAYIKSEIDKEMYPVSDDTLPKPKSLRFEDKIEDLYKGRRLVRGDSAELSLKHSLKAHAEELGWKKELGISKEKWAVNQIEDYIKKNPNEGGMIRNAVTHDGDRVVVETNTDGTWKAHVEPKGGRKIILDPSQNEIPNRPNKVSVKDSLEDVPKKKAFSDTGVNKRISIETHRSLPIESNPSSSSQIVDSSLSKPRVSITQDSFNTKVVSTYEGQIKTLFKGGYSNPKFEAIVNRSAKEFLAQRTNVPSYVRTVGGGFTNKDYISIRSIFDEGQKLKIKILPKMSVGDYLMEVTKRKLAGSYSIK